MKVLEEQKAIEYNFKYIIIWSIQNVDSRMKNKENVVYTYGRILFNLKNICYT